MSSHFITFEGPEGSGKSTQAHLLAENLESKGLNVRLTREPGGEQVSEQIRKILLDGSDNSLTEHTELLLYLAARAQHTERLIQPHLRVGSTVICARYTDSTVAYQGYGSGIDLDLIHRMNAFVTDGLMPDLTFLLDIPVEVGLSRQSQQNRMERKAVEYHQRVRQGFLEEARLNPERIVVIDASQDIDSIQQQILRLVAEKLNITV